MTANGVIRLIYRFSTHQTGRSCVGVWNLRSWLTECKSSVAELQEVIAAFFQLPEVGKI